MKVSAAMLLGSITVGWLTAVCLPAGAAPQNGASPKNLLEAKQDANETESEKETMIQPKTDSESSSNRWLASPRPWKSLASDFLEDQKSIWTSPGNLKLSDTQWLVPIAGLTAGFIQTDADYSRHISHNPSTLSHYSNLSTAGLGALAGGAGGLWLLSYHTHNEHWRETGILAGEAAVNSLVVVEAMKYAARRERPFQGNGDGYFFQPGGTSFPSEHAATAWAIAGVIAHEYPGPLSKVLAYGLASVVSYSRLRARQHYPSDVFVGGLLGDLIGQQVYSNHQDPELGGVAWRSLRQTFSGDSQAEPGNQGSPFVPLDSWIYPIFDRLVALGYVQAGSLGQRPWTRLECAGLLREAMERADSNGSAPAQVENLLDDLAREFSTDLELLGGGENRSAHLESAYSRITGISGQPLTDSEHFGQTITDDFGRPFEEGVNNVTGTSGWATAGRWVAYVRGEYQYAPSGPAYSEDVRNFIATIDLNPVQPATPVPSHSQLQLLDAYVGLGLANWELSFGQQSVWWGPGRMGPFLFSDNATPVRMIQIKRVAPMRLPWVFRYMGPVYMDAFFGNLDGHNFPANPAFHGEKISFKPTSNLEFGFSRTVVMGGQGHPLTPKAIFNSYFSATSSVGYALNADPGKRSGGFDFSYRVPFVRDWLTLYCDAISDDDPSPLAAPRRAGVNPGIYMPKLPFLNRLDLRVEAASTDIPHSTTPGHFIYFDTTYHDLYTNDGQIMGNPVGRDGKSIQAWSRYWIGPRTNIEFSYLHDQVSQQFVPGGGNMNDASVRADFWIHRVWSVSASVQYERWNFPILAATPQRDVATSLGFVYYPTGGRP